MKKIILLFLCSVLNILMSAQTRVGFDQYLQIFGGINTYSGEIGGSNTGINFLNDWNLTTPRWQAGIGYKFAVNNHVNLRMLTQYMRLTGNSQNLKNSSTFSYVRSFETQLFEVGANLEYGFWNHLNLGKIQSQTYIFGGFGLIFGTKVDFKSEPPIEESTTNIVNFNPNPAPFLTVGLGFNRNFNHVAAGIELWGQFMMSDFIDGIKYYKSQYYDFSAGISLILSLRTSKQTICHCEY